MALARYRDSFWYPSGILASNQPARIFPLSSSSLAPIFTDITGTTPLPNPLNTSPLGVLEFWAEEGEYWIHIDTESFRISVGSPNSDVFEVSASTISTGVVWGGNIEANALTPSSLDIAPLVGYIVDHTTDEIRPTATRVVSSGLTVPMDAGALSRPVTHWFMTSVGTTFQQATIPTNAEHRENIYLGRTVQTGGVITVAKSLPVILAQPANQWVDLTTDLGPFNISGNTVSPNGINLSINKSSGSVFSRSFSHYISGIRTNDPHEFFTASQTPVTLRYTLRTEDPLSAPTTFIDPTRFDNNGVLTLIGGGTNTSTIQRIWLIPADNVADQIVMQYGQTTYSSLTNAVNNIGSEVFVSRASISEVAPLIGWVCVTRAATNLSDPTQAVFVKAEKFPVP